MAKILSRRAQGEQKGNNRALVDLYDVTLSDEGAPTHDVIWGNGRCCANMVALHADRGWLDMMLGSVCRFMLEHPNLLLTAVMAVMIVPTACVGYFVHCSLVKYCYLPHARKWCSRNGYEVVSQRSFLVFTPSGAKSEYTGFEIASLDSNHQKRFIVLLVGLRGVKRVVSIADAPLSETRAIPMRNRARA